MSAGGILALPVLSAVAALLLLAASPAACHTLPLRLIRTSSISAAPAFLPSVPTTFPSLAPALAPDAMPVLPTPGAGAAAAPPVTSTLPTIPSSLSPPNPDELQPNSVVAPTGSAALTSAASAAPSAAVACGLAVLMWWLELAGK